MASYLVARLPTAAAIFSFGTSFISKSRSSNNSSSISRSSSSSSSGSASPSDATASSSSSDSSSSSASPSDTTSPRPTGDASCSNDSSSINNLGPSAPKSVPSSTSSGSGMITDIPEVFSFKIFPVTAGVIIGAGLFKSHSCFTASSVSSLINVDSSTFFFGIKKSKLGTLKLGLNLHIK